MGFTTLASMAFGHTSEVAPCPAGFAQKHVGRSVCSHSCVEYTRCDPPTSSCMRPLVTPSAVSLHELATDTATQKMAALPPMGPLNGSMRCCGALWRALLLVATTLIAVFCTTPVSMEAYQVLGIVTDSLNMKQAVPPAQRGTPSTSWPSALAGTYAGITYEKAVYDLAALGIAGSVEDLLLNDGDSVSPLP